jgi:hypothetical protein
MGHFNVVLASNRGHEQLIKYDPGVKVGSLITRAAAKLKTKKKNATLHDEHGVQLSDEQLQGMVSHLILD